MSITNSARAVPLGSIVTFRIVSFFERAINSLIAWRTARATAKALHELTDAQLDDIGLSRGEIDAFVRAQA